MNYSNQPTYGVMPWIPDDARPFFDVVMIVFVVCFFVGVHYRMHVAQHLIPPPYVFWLREWLRQWWG